MNSKPTKVVFTNEPTADVCRDAIRALLVDVMVWNAERADPAPIGLAATSPKCPAGHLGEEEQEEIEILFEKEEVMS